MTDGMVEDIGSDRLSTRSGQVRTVRTGQAGVAASICCLAASWLCGPIREVAHPQTQATA